ncbi:unnamed protein product [Toxocara canis]|uniref:Acyl-CoA-binding domain-containing protein 7 n=1 Tax=Toxocara canis TaxID=6265 RepID=A0A183UPY8_TOXCA|nr:unnamed protein product [Toxocara canis]
MEESFYEAVELYKRMRARFDQRRVLKNEYELLVKFDEHTYNLFGLYQQAIVGDINVPKMDYFDPQETSWMWGWIKGNQKWHAWNKCKGLSKFDAMFMYINEVQKLESELSSLVDEWKDEQDPRIPDQNAWVSEEEAEERCAIIEKAKAERRSVIFRYSPQLFIAYLYTN